MRSSTTTWLVTDMKRPCLLLAALWPFAASAQIETPGSGATVTSTASSSSTFSNLFYQPVTMSASNVTWVNMLAGSMKVVPLTANTTIVPTNLTAGANVSLLLIAQGAAQYNVVMPSNVRLFSGSLTNAVTTNKAMIVSFTAFDSQITNLVATISVQP